MTQNETEAPKKQCRTCRRTLVLGDKPDRCTMCLADDWAKKHNGRYVQRHLGPNRAQRRAQLKHERTRAL